MDFGFEGRMWDLIVSVPDHCLPFYFKLSQTNKGPERPTKVVRSELQKFPDSSLKSADQKAFL